MNIRLIKLSIFLLLVAICATGVLDGASVRANSDRPPSRNTGAPGEQNCTSCHSGTVNSGGGTLTLTGLPAGYMPNQEIPLMVKITQGGRSQFGFQVTAIDDTGKAAGTLVVTDAVRTVASTGTVSGNSRTYIGQTADGTNANGTNSGTYNVTWRAPATAVGRVTFYVNGMAGNNTGGTGGDLTYTLSQAIMPGGSTVAALANTSAASYLANGSLTPDAISAAWGMGLSQNTASATTLPLPTTLDGAQVMVTDAANTTRMAGLFFVSPTQVNYLVPTGTVNGTATVTIQRNGAAVARGTAMIDNIAPGLFSANANGQGAAAAVILRIRNGQQTFEPVSQRNTQTNRFDPIPIDLGPATDQVYLVTFGTGFRGAMQSAVSASIGGTISQVLYSGPQSMLAGLDQANILIPRALIGRGMVDVTMAVAGKPANTVQISIR
jgi:uncharacterized protein (TIGR03437 family)